MYSSAFQAIGQRAAVTIRKISVKADSTSDRAISLGVRWRMAPSTRAIMRSRNDLPAPAVISTTMRSERTRVPPVTPERSPPASRIDGGRFAGDGRLVDRGDAFDDFAVAGDDLARLDDDVDRRLAESVDDSLFDRAVVAQAVSGRLAPRLAERIGLGLAAGLGQRRREVGKQHRQKQPDVEREQITMRTCDWRIRAAWPT